MTWSLELYLNQRHYQIMPNNLYDYPYGVVKEYLFLMSEAPKLQSMIQESDEAVKAAEAEQNGQ